MTILASMQHIQKYHGAQLVLGDITIEVRQGERIGLIGSNGSGKSTLLRVLAGLTPPDSGTLAIAKGTRIGYLAQVPEVEDRYTVGDLLARGFREARECREEMSRLEQEMAEADGERLNGILQRYAALQERFERLGGYEMESRIEQVAHGLGIPRSDYERPYATLSGGEKTKAGLASLLIEQPTLLLLDEPTNHLDTQGIEWLESFLRTYAGTCILVSHDRYFLDQVVTGIVELEDGEAFPYRTSYSGYVKEKEERLLQEFAAYQEQQKVIRKMKETIKQLQEWGKLGGNEKFFRRAASMQKALDRMEKMKRPVLQRRTADFELQAAERSGKQVVLLEGVRKRYGERPILQGADGRLLYGDRTVLVGGNGAGKSTLMKLLLGEAAPDGGKVELGARVEAGYLAQQDAPDSKRTVLEHYCREAEAEEGEARRELAGYLFYGAAVFKSLASLSGGEWTRLRLAILMRRKPNLLLLDEPTNHLDIASREALEEALEDYEGTVLAISHDRYFTNRIARSVWELREGIITPYLGGYDDYKAKSSELRERRAEKAASREQPKPAAAPAPRPEQRRGGVRREQLESRIEELEMSIRECSAELEQPELASDPAGLAKRWQEREALQAQLNELLEQWVELTE
ncbi:ribosomal protection-like ABC-F family protein [Gorillibacterium sp. sgz5001074]|uniref:ribosomal protection-like ABC-F family protein n=1 Tax=Gorillibacterium sp. sgz5001074 TaxID=3446695 RepID=UPI003F68164E